MSARPHQAARRRASDETGAGGAFALAVVTATVVCALAVVSLAGGLVTRQRVVAAADAAALAAADALVGAIPGEPCTLAEQVATAHRVVLDACLLEGAEALVSTRLDVVGVPIRARSRAGPAP